MSIVFLHQGITIINRNENYVRTSGSAYLEVPCRTSRTDKGVGYRSLESRFLRGYFDEGVSKGE